MPYDNKGKTDVLVEAINLLSPYVEISGRHALISALLRNGSNPIQKTGTVNVPNNDDELLKYVMQLIDIVDGGLAMREFMDKLEGFSKNDEEFNKMVRKFIRISEWQGIYNDMKAGSEFRDTPKLAPYFNNGAHYSSLNGLDADYKLTLPAGGICGVSDSVQIGQDLEGLYAIEFLNPRLGLSGRETPGVSVFTSLINVTEISRCVPYVNVKMKQLTERLATGSNGVQKSGLSLFSFLNGTEERPKGGLDKFISFPENNASPSISGMELFTSPQTLVPARNSRSISKNVSTGQEGALDRFRPFMTLKSLNLTASPIGGGILSTTSGQLDIILHDRSRLHEIAMLIRPGLYSAMELDIEYGWSHPYDVTKKEVRKNPIAAFLDSQRRRNRYGITSNSITLDDAGQVNITLNIFEKGYDQFQTMNISNVNGEKSAIALKRTFDDLAKILKKETGNESNIKHFEEVFGDVIMTHAGSPSTSLAVNQQTLEELRLSIEQAKSKVTAQDEAQKMIDSLETLFNGSSANNKSLLDDFRTSAFTNVSKQLQDLKNAKEIFPFHDVIVRGTGDGCNIPRPFDASIAEVTVKGINKEYDLQIKNTISLGRILLAFVGKPLIKSKQYEEVHFLFYPLNNKASFLRNLCISKFPLPVDYLTNEIYELMKSNMEINIDSFINMLNSKFVGNIAAHPYGFRNAYTFDKIQKDQAIVNFETSGAPQKNEQFLYESMLPSENENGESNVDTMTYHDQMLHAAGIYDGTFNLPQLCVLPECVPKRSDETKTILRIHVFDERAKGTSFSSMSQLLDAANSADFEMFGINDGLIHPFLSSAPETSAEDQKIELDNAFEAVKDLIVKNEKVDGKESDDPTITIDLSRIIWGINSVKKIKRFVSQYIPTIRYGRNNGMITNVTMNSNTDGAVNNINIQRLASNDALAPEAVQNMGLPMQIHPSECNIDLMGCPLLAYGQQFFLDFDTGTSADNIYSVNTIEHRIEPGSFTTSAKMVFLDAYSKYVSQRRKAKILSTYLQQRFALSVSPEVEQEIEELWSDQSPQSKPPPKALDPSDPWANSYRTSANYGKTLIFGPAPKHYTSTESFLGSARTNFSANFGQPRADVKPDDTLEKRFHEGIDISMPGGTLLYSPVDARVVRISQRMGTLVLSFRFEGSNHYMVYMHMQKFLAKLGRDVRAQRDDSTTVPLGESGNVGTEAYHLHMEVWTEDETLADLSMTGEKISKSLSRILPREGDSVKEGDSFGTLIPGSSTTKIWARDPKIFLERVFNKKYLTEEEKIIEQRKEEERQKKLAEAEEEKNFELY